LAIFPVPLGKKVRSEKKQPRSRNANLWSDKVV